MFPPLSPFLFEKLELSRMLPILIAADDIHAIHFDAPVYQTRLVRVRLRDKCSLHMHMIVSRERRV